LGLDRILHDEIDGAAEQLAEALLHAEEMEQSDGPVELDEQIHVAVEPVLSAGDGTEEVKTLVPEPGEFVPLLGESALDFVSGYRRDDTTGRREHLEGRWTGPRRRASSGARMLCGSKLARSASPKSGLRERWGWGAIPSSGAKRAAGG